LGKSRSFTTASEGFNMHFLAKNWILTCTININDP
jgi:hypothetical protein